MTMTCLISCSTPRNGETRVALFVDLFCLAPSNGLAWQCSFEIISRDSFGNKRFHTASDEWQVSMTSPSGISWIVQVGESFRRQYPPLEPMLLVGGNYDNPQYPPSEPTLAVM